MRKGRRFVAMGVAAVFVQLAASTSFAVDRPEYDQIRTTYRLIAELDDPTVCVGEEGRADVRVHADLAGHLRYTGWVSLPNLGPGDMDGALVTARVQGDYVRLKEAVRVTGLHGAPGYTNAVFRYEGVRAGESQITFEAEESAMRDLGWPGVLSVDSNSADITVINCKFVLHAFSTFLLEGEAGLTFGTAMTNVELAQSDDGQLRQSVTVSWYAWAGQVGDCFGQMNATGSEAAVFGELSDQGALTIDVKYEPFHVTMSGNCGGFETDVTPSALHFVVGAEGGSGNLEQNLTTRFGGVPGAASYVVVPMDGS